jgi:hypothetical protein
MLTILEPMPVLDLAGGEDNSAPANQSQDNSKLLKIAIVLLAINILLKFVRR